MGREGEGRGEEGRGGEGGRRHSSWPAGLPASCREMDGPRAKRPEPGWSQTRSQTQEKSGWTRAQRKLGRGAESRVRSPSLMNEDRAQSQGKVEEFDAFNPCVCQVPSLRGTLGQVLGCATNTPQSQTPKELAF